MEPQGAAATRSCDNGGAGGAAGPGWVPERPPDSAAGSSAGAGSNGATQTKISYPKRINKMGRYIICRARGGNAQSVVR